MDKKDIYEHLAEIYLDASSKKRGRKTKKHSGFRNFFLFGFIFIFGFSLFLFTNRPKNKSSAANFALVLQPDIARINFNFDPARKEIYSINLNKLNLSRFKELGFSIKKSDYKDIISLRVEFISAFKEKSEIYLKNISHKWQDYKIAFSDFKNISDWSQMLSLSFIIEEWNTKEKRDVVYLDNIRLLR